ncbi:MAG: ABC transporter permease [Gemmatimonadales bacterium]|nr:ABC transporter permease [Gemmatimonadales bacterium]
MTGLGQDLRYAARGLWRRPGYTVAVVLTLALGIGANTAVFSLIRGIVLRPLPYAEPERLFSVYEEHPQEGPRLASYPTFLDWRRDSRSFEALAFIRGATRILQLRDGSEQVIAGYVSPEYFRAVGQRPLLGRAFLEEEERSGAPVAVISNSLADRRLGGAAAALGATLRLGGAAVRVVGVMPPGFGYPAWAALWMPIASLPAADRSVLSARALHTDSRIVGRLSPGVQLDRVRGEMNTIAARLARAYPAEHEGWTRVGVAPLAAELMGDAEMRLLILQGTVLILLVICCVNLVNLALARGLVRSRELAVRAALGASRRRVVQQLLVESLLLALAGGVAGAVVADWGVGLLKRSAPDVLPRLQEVGLDGWVLAFTAVVALATSVAFGLLPALRVSRPAMLARLADGGERSGIGPGRSRLRSVLVVSELALAMILLVGAGLLLRSFDRLERVSLGFDPDGLVTLRVITPSPGYEEPGRVLELYRRLAESVGAVPGVRAVALTNHLPLTGASMNTQVEVDGRAAGVETESSALFRTVSPDYFGTMRIPILRGRGLQRSDMSQSTGAVVVNQAFVLRYWPNADPIGRRVTVFKSVQPRADFGERLDGTVVGVAGDVRHFSQEDELAPEVYLPYTRNPPLWIQLVARTADDPERLIPALRRAVLSVEPGLPVVGEGLWQGFATMERLLAATRAPRTFSSVLLLAFALTALLMAVVGLYGVISFLVVQREREIGVRMALGARPADMLALVLRSSLRWCIAGIVTGTAGALALNRYIASLLFEVSPNDPVTFVVVALILGAVAAVASLVPARRAALTDPMRTLRSE